MNKTKTKPGQILIWQQIPKLTNIAILMKFKIHISQPIAKFYSHNKAEIKPDTVWQDKFDTIFCYQKTLKYFNPNKVGLIEGRFFGGGGVGVQFDASFIFQEEFI